MIGNIKILDCTLRDGGYVNDWRFGEDKSLQIAKLSTEAGMDYVELGMLRQCDFEEGKLVFDTVSRASEHFPYSGSKRAIMVELGGNYPIDSIPDHQEGMVEMIRVMIWKRMIREGLEFCTKLIEKGYEVGIQATRTDEYTDEEFAEFVQLYNAIHPTALYVVDSFGVMDKDAVIRYMKIADKLLDKDVILGYHAHNNLQQAYTNAVSIIEHGFDHCIMLDASVLGMGRGAGNLCTELLVKYLLEQGSTKYNISALYEIADKYVMPYKTSESWGYSMPYMLSATYGRNPSLVNYMLSKNLSILQMEQVFRYMREQGVGIKYDESECDEIIKSLNILVLSP